MAYGTLRVENLKTHQIKRCEQHNLRLYPEGKMPENINPEKTPYNHDWIAGDKPTFKDAINARLEGVPVRKNSVIAIEFVMGASEDFYKGNYEATGYLSNCVKFLSRRYGWDNIVSISQHFDESNPHVHVLVTPIIEKTVKWKNQKGEGVKKEKRLCARDITGGKEKLRQLQTDFHEYIVPYGKVAGVEFVRGTLVEQQTREYKKRTDYRMAEIARIAKRAEQEIEAAKRLELQKQIVREVGELEKDQKKVRELERKTEFIKKGKNRGKGNDFKMKL